MSHRNQIKSVQNRIEFQWRMCTDGGGVTVSPNVQVLRVAHDTPTEGHLGRG